MMLANALYALGNSPSRNRAAQDAALLRDNINPANGAAFKWLTSLPEPRGKADAQLLREVRRVRDKLLADPTFPQHVETLRAMFERCPELREGLVEFRDTLHDVQQFVPE